MDEQFTLQLQQFEGPLDLLLSLIQERKLYINEISLSHVTDGYLSYVKELERLPMAETAQFILIASTLLLIKSRSLLPTLELSEEEEGTIKDLTDRLEHYQKIKLASRSLLTRWSGVHMRLPLKQPVSPVIVFRPAEATLATIRDAAEALIRSLPSQTFREQVRVEKTRTLEEVITSLRGRIMTAARTSFRSIASGASRTEVILHFLALLELVKGGGISAEQTGAFDDIMVESQDVSVPHYG